MKEKTSERSHPGIFVAGLLLCIICGILFICNMMIIIKGTLHPEVPPSVAGLTPMVVLSGSMSSDAPDHIEAGDLIFVTKTDIANLRKGDIIAFWDNRTFGGFAEVKEGLSGGFIEFKQAVYEGSS